tara:strand:+ start:207 stop:1793 length:1587 start_codon:yes stop_codon:yes gene_type:complete
MKTVLSLADHGHFIEHGFVIVKKAVPVEVVQQTVACLEGELISDFDIGKACISDTLLKALSELFGPEISFKTKYDSQDLARPQQTGKEWSMMSAHVDDAYPTLMPNDWAVGSFIFLTKVISHGGAFICFSGSPLRYRKGMSKSYFSIKEIAKAHKYSGRGKEFLADPGDVLLFQHLMGHTGSDNVSNPVTRHALLNRWVPKGVRIAPGEKPFSQMATIEKANSVRYLEHKFDVDLGANITLKNDFSSEILSRGWNWNEKSFSVRSYALLHFNGKARLFVISNDAPDHIRYWHSVDLINWEEEKSPIEVRLRIHSLHFHQYGKDAVLSVTYENGFNCLYSSIDFSRWHAKAEMSQVTCVLPWYIYPDYPSKIAKEKSVLAIYKNELTEVICHWGLTWSDATMRKNKSIALKAAGKIEDFVLAPYHSDSKCAFIADVKFCDEKNTKLTFSLPRDMAVAKETLQPMSSDLIDNARLLRVYNRGPLFWLVTVLGTNDRLFWGCIDWSESTPLLRALVNADDFNKAKSLVGMI